MSDSTITFVIIGVVVVLFVSNRVPVGIVAIGTSIALWATGVLELEEATAGFGDPAVLFIASLFVISEALDSTGVTAWVGQQLVDRAGTSRTKIVAYVMVACALLTALVTPNASVAALVPVVVIIAVRVGQHTSQLLMPLAFAAHAGALLALTGSPVSVLVSQSAEEAGLGRFGFFEFALTGVPLLLGTVVIVIVGGQRLLPHRSPLSLPPDLTDLESQLQRQYFVDGERGDQLFGHSYGAAEVVVPPRSPAIGERLGPGMQTHGGALSVVSVMRNERPIGEVELAAGDVVLVKGTWQALSREVDADDDVLAVNAPDLIRRQTVPLGVGAREALGVLAVMVVLLATDLVPPAIAGIGSACVLVLARVVRVEQAYRSIGWTTVVLVAGMLPLSTAMQTSGAADQLAERLVDLVGDSGPYPLLIGVFLLTAILGQLISNMATALIVIPVALSAAAELDVAGAPVLMCLNVAAAAALLTPIATPANLMVMEPGGYRFGDYWRLGGVLLVWYFVVSVVLVPLIWSL